MAIHGEKILVAGATGQVALPLAVSLAGDNEVWGISRFSDQAARQKLEAAGVNCVAVDLVEPDLSPLPTDFTYGLNLAISKSGDWNRDLDASAGSVALLMEHCQGAKAFLHCSSTAVYKESPDATFTEDDELGDNHGVWAGLIPGMNTYSIGKIAAEAVARYGARRFELPTTIARLNVPYGDNGGWPALHLDMMAGGMAVPVHPARPNRFSPIHDDDILGTLDGLLAGATVPATTVNWGGRFLHRGVVRRDRPAHRGGARVRRHRHDHRVGRGRHQPHGRPDRGAPACRWPRAWPGWWPPAALTC